MFNTPVAPKYAGAKPNAVVGGTVIVTSAKSSGSTSVDKKTFDKFKSKFSIKGEGTIDTGPNAGKTIKFKFKAKSKGSLTPL